ncbi:hypothetical protein NDU88_000653 [Pleurodeles waltl]|uniref:Uncharacterized protein n=1 Tax=Pleurodeles waltl TaxID=8319 RepID=A0AAV7V5M7_PLEWA|nr:hypothetical protein NDU88_000653 [Pleurodeles waltl]
MQPPPHLTGITAPRQLAACGGPTTPLGWEPGSSLLGPRYLVQGRGRPASRGLRDATPLAPKPLLLSPAWVCSLLHWRWSDRCRPQRPRASRGPARKAAATYPLTGPRPPHNHRTRGRVTPPGPGFSCTRGTQPRRPGGSKPMGHCVEHRWVWSRLRTKWREGRPPGPLRVHEAAAQTVRIHRPQ